MGYHHWKPSPFTLLYPGQISLYANKRAPELQVFAQSSTNPEDLGISPWPFQCRLYIQSLPGRTVSVWTPPSPYPRPHVKKWCGAFWQSCWLNWEMLSVFSKRQIGTYETGSKPNITCYWMLNFLSKDLLSVQKCFALILNIEDINCIFGVVCVWATDHWSNVLIQTR